MYGMYYLGIVLEVFNDRIKVLRRTKIYQFSCEIPTNVVPGSWINFFVSNLQFEMKLIFIFN